MTPTKLVEEVKSLPVRERTQVVEKVILHLAPEGRKTIERFLRRLQHPEVPESFWRGVEDHEDGRTVDMEVALHETPPGRQ